MGEKNQKRTGRTLEGKACLYLETGSEGSTWAFEEHSDKVENKDSSIYDKLHFLKNGDYLEIFHPETNEEIWSGYVDLEERTTIDENILGFRVHSKPLNAKEEEWIKYFVQEYPARLTQKEKKE